MDLATLSSVLALTATAVGTATTIASGNAASKSNKETSDIKAKMMANEYSAKQKERKNLLQQQLAKQRAIFSSSGLNPDEGSARSVLDKITNTSEDENNTLRQDYKYNLDLLSNNASSIQQQNLLSGIGTLTSGVANFTGGLNNFGKKNP